MSPARRAPLAARGSLQALCPQEYEILRELLVSGLLCDRVDALVVEWHRRKFDNSSSVPAAADEALEWLMQSVTCSSLRLFTLDRDRQPHDSSRGFVNTVPERLAQRRSGRESRTVRSKLRK